MAPELSGTIESGTEAAKSIMTTDTKKKEAAVQFTIDGKTVTVGGMCKGSGMIHPNMCTMLSFVKMCIRDRVGVGVGIDITLH